MYNGLKNIERIADRVCNLVFKDELMDEDLDGIAIYMEFYGDEFTFSLYEKATCNLFYKKTIKKGEVNASNQRDIRRPTEAGVRKIGQEDRKEKEDHSLDGKG